MCLYVEKEKSNCIPEKNESKEVTEICQYGSVYKAVFTRV